MFTASNSLSFIRAPLAFLFLQDNATIRVIAIILAMLTDSIDGYLARKNRSVTAFGTILDPAMDKFFVYFAIVALFLEQKLTLWQVGAMLARDVFLCLFGLIMLVTGRWKQVVFKAIKWGKVTTALQFIVLIGLSLGIAFSWGIYGAFLAMGWLAFLELFKVGHKPVNI